MAEVENNAGGAGRKHSGKPRQSKKSTRIDMTAMVDVAFLLLTFFILTTTLASPKLMQFVVPVNDDIGKPVQESKVLTLILGAEDKVHYYYGTVGDDLLTTNFASNGIRRLIHEHLSRFPNRCDQTTGISDCWDPIIVVKPHHSSRYQNLVDAFDELKILDAPKYALGEVLPEDSLLLLDHGLR